MQPGEMTHQLRALTALPEVLSSIPSNHMGLTSIYSEIRCPFLVCLKTATVYLHIIINKSLKKKEKEKMALKKKETETEKLP